MLYAKTLDIHTSEIPLLKYLQDALTQCAYLDSKPVSIELLTELFDQGKITAYKDEYGQVTFRVICESHPLHSSIDTCPIYCGFHGRHFNDNAPDIQLALLVITVSDHGTFFSMKGCGTSPLFRISELADDEHVGIFRLPMTANELSMVHVLLGKHYVTLDVFNDEECFAIMHNMQSARNETYFTKIGQRDLMPSFIELCNQSREITKQSKLMCNHNLNYLALKLWLECYGLSELTNTPTIKELTIGDASDKLAETSLDVICSLLEVDNSADGAISDLPIIFTVNGEGTLTFKHYNEEIPKPAFEVIRYGTFTPKE